MIRNACFFSLLCLTACDRFPDSYPPPEQRHPVQGLNSVAESMVEMGNTRAAQFIAKDIYGPTGSTWRWTSQEPTVHFLLLGTQNLKFSTDFAIWNDSFKITGPLEITYLVNGNPLDKIRYTSPGQKHFEKPVPHDWLNTNTETSVGLQVDKLYTAPADGNKFGVILVRLGLKPSGPKASGQ